MSLKCFGEVVIKSLFFTLLFFSSSLFAQDSRISEIQKLNQQIFALNNEGKLDEAISVAEKIVEMEKKSKTLNARSYAILLDNQAKLKEKRIKQNQAAYDGGNAKKSEQNRLLKLMKEDARDVDELYTEILKIYEEDIKIETAHLASVKRAFANFLYQYARERNEIGRMYSEAISLYQKLLGEKNQNTLAVTLELGKYNFENGNLEGALELFERYIQAKKETNGENSPWLAPALRYYAVILKAIDLEDEAKKIAAQISKLTGKEENPNDLILDISSRSPDSLLNIKVAYSTRGPLSTPEATNTGRLFGADVISRGDGLDMGLTNVGYKEYKVRVLVDENGNVLEAESLSDNKKAAKRAEEAVMKWKFKPLVYQGKLRRLRGIVFYKEKL